ncbi:MAG TPA: acyloxyacyl hydrolase [Pyrinomonadaceae bacterium]|nr:acyloxyacyl hydrolase [Pyrinomonadaceae bacterium]
MGRIGRVALVLLWVASLAAAARAQPRRAAGVSGGGVEESGAAGAQAGVFGLERAANEFGVWGGGSWDSPTLIGRAEDARVALLGLRYARVLARGDNLALKYTLDAVPIAALSYRSEVPEPLPPSGLVARRVRRNITGAGLSPVGFQLNFRRRERVQPFAQASGGFVYFAERVPLEGGAQFNFTADFGGGLQMKTGARRAWTLGYRYHHVSNGYRAQLNPGFDANLFYVGYSIFR